MRVAGERLLLDCTLEQAGHLMQGGRALFEFVRVMSVVTVFRRFGCTWMQISDADVSSKARVRPPGP